MGLICRGTRITFWFSSWLQQSLFWFGFFLKTNFSIVFGLSFYWKSNPLTRSFLNCCYEKQHWVEECCSKLQNAYSSAQLTSALGLRTASKWSEQVTKENELTSVYLNAWCRDLCFLRGGKILRTAAMAHMSCTARGQSEATNPLLPPGRSWWEHRERMTYWKTWSPPLWCRAGPARGGGLAVAMCFVGVCRTACSSADCRWFSQWGAICWYLVNSCWMLLCLVGWGRGGCCQRGLVLWASALVINVCQHPKQQSG